MKEKLFFTRCFYLVTAGMFFLINPLYNIFDVLPDFFGYLLIYIGMSELSTLDGRFESALKKLQYLIVLSILKLLLTVPVMSSVVDSDRLLATFCFALVELLLLIIAFSDFFEGFSNIVLRDGSSKTLNVIPNARFLTIMFFLVKIIFSVLPELYALMETQSQIEVSKFEVYNSLLSTQGIVRLFTIIVVFILGIFWYVSFVKMMHTAKKDIDFTRKLQERYNNEYLSHPERQRLKRLRAGLFTAIFGCVFFFDFAIDGTRILPATATALIFIVSILFLKSNGSFKRTLRFAPFVCLIQILTEVYRYVFVDTEVIKFSQLNITTVAFSSLVVIIYAGATILFMRIYLEELRGMYTGITGNEAPTFSFAKFLFLTFLIIQSLQIVIPPIHSNTAVLHFLIVALWVYLCSKRFLYMIDDYSKEVRLQ